MSDQITYGEMVRIRTKTGESVSVPVMMGRKRVGHIRSMEHGFAYYPKGASKMSGVPFETVHQVKKSIENDQ